MTIEIHADDVRAVLIGGRQYDVKPGTLVVDDGAAGVHSLGRWYRFEAEEGFTMTGPLSAVQALIGGPPSGGADASAGVSTVPRS